MLPDVVLIKVVGRLPRLSRLPDLFQVVSGTDTLLEGKSRITCLDFHEVTIISPSRASLKSLSARGLPLWGRASFSVTPLEPLPPWHLKLSTLRCQWWPGWPRSWHQQEANMPHVLSLFLKSFRHEQFSQPDDKLLVRQLWTNRQSTHCTLNWRAEIHAANCMFTRIVYFTSKDGNRAQSSLTFTAAKMPLKWDCRSWKLVICRHKSRQLSIQRRLQIDT